MNNPSPSGHRQSFIGRVQEQRQFRIALEGLLAHHRQWLAQTGQSAPPWTEDAGPHDDTYPRIFLVQGAGGIGKSWLTRRCLDIAAGAETSPPVLTLYDDLSLESAVLTPTDLLNRLYRRLVEAGQSGAAQIFRQTQTRLSELSERVSRFRADHPALWQSLQEQAGASQPPQSAADLLLARMAQDGLLSPEELEDLQTPHQTLARGLVTALQTIIARQPLVIALDNLESIVPLEPFLRDHLVLPTVHLPLLWILSGRNNLADERTVQVEGQTRTHKGYRDFLAQNPPLVWDMSTFGDAELRTYLEAETRRRGVNLTIDDTLVEALKTASAGIPLVVEMVTDALFFMDREQFVQTFGPEDKSLSPAARLEQVAAHYLRHGLTRDDDLERLYALALLRRHPEPDAL
ncbi:MAG: hypothetical protein D6784_14780, partial [Chloroflexi bacterium]